MANTHATGKRYLFKVVNSPVRKLTLVASDDGLAAILWENDRPHRVRLNIEAEDDRHPVLVETARQLDEYFAANEIRSRCRWTWPGRRFNARSGMRC